MKLKIKPIEKSELKTVKKEFPNSAPHEERLKQQLEEDSAWLIGWIGKRPVAHLQIRFQGDKTKKVRQNLKDCPHLGNLGVAEDMRKQGLASKMIKYAENLAKTGGFKHLGLAVEYGNTFLKGIYERRGYKEWKHGAMIDTWKQSGKLKRRKCHYLVKRLK